MPEATGPHLSRPAVIAFVLGLSSLLLSLFAALPAMYVGLRAVRAINSGDGRLRGRRLAIAGLALGSIVTLLTALGCAALGVLYLHDRSHVAGCTNNFRQVGAAVHKYFDLHGEHFPAGTVPNPSLAAEQRLSWQAAIMSLFAQGTPAGKKWEKLAGEIAFQDGWDAPSNDEPRRTNVSPLLCPAYFRGFSTGQPGQTSYVGVAGVGVDAARLPLQDPRAGFFGYDRILTQADISAGISSTMMVVETTRDNGPWLAGGPPTLRGLDPDCDHYIGHGQPFGGLHLDGLNVLWADGSVRFVRDRIEPAAFRALAQIHRGEDD
jgi:prepilin-type processing-associated H-X9-DG protein